MSLGDKNVMRIMKMRDVKMRPIFLLIVSILPMMAHAQWTEQDSLRLQEFLSGKEEIRLNPEFQKAIESGTFLREPICYPRQVSCRLRKTSRNMYS